MLIAAAVPAHALSADENLAGWRRASADERVALARVLMARLRPGLSEADLSERATGLKRCLDEAASDGHALATTLAGAAELCGRLHELAK